MAERFNPRMISGLGNCRFSDGKYSIARFLLDQVSSNSLCIEFALAIVGRLNNLITTVFLLSTIFYTNVSPSSPGISIEQSLI
jgi:hypothetical protein